MSRLRRIHIVFLFPVMLAMSACSWGRDTYAIEEIFNASKDPWSMAWLPDGRMLVTEKSGALFLLDGQGGFSAIDGLPAVHRNGQGGFLDVAVHPEYRRNGWIYLSYASREGKGDGSNTAIIRAKIKDKALVDIETLYKASPNSTRGQHYGGRIVLDGKGYLYFSVGDRGDRDHNPQDPSRDGGKIYRLTDDGRIPQDNPFVGQSGAKAAVYSFGHRNPQGLALNPITGELWEHEHGPRGGDELNRIKAGANYGWPILSYGINYNGSAFAEAQEREGYESPVTYWDPSIAPSGMVFVTSDKYPELKGDLLLGSLKFGYVEVCELDGNQVVAKEPILKDVGRVRDIRQGPDGFLYLAVSGRGVLRVLPR